MRRARLVWIIIGSLGLLFAFQNCSQYHFAVTSSSNSPSLLAADSTGDQPFDISTMTHYEVAQNDPRASDANPGTPDAPWLTVSHAVQSLQPGDRVLVRAGTYREAISLTSSGTTDKPIWVTSKIGENVVISAADVLSGFNQPDPSKPIYQTAWARGGDPTASLVMRTEQIIIDGRLLTQVSNLASMTAGTFFADIINHQLSIWDVQSRNLMVSGGPIVEAAMRSQILAVTGANVTVQGFTFRYGSNYAQNGEILLDGDFVTLSFATIEWSNANGAQFVSHTGITVQDCVFQYNGQEGFTSVMATNLHFVHNLVTANNVKGYDVGWEAGGDKIVMSRNAVIEGNRFVANHGSGLWFDIGNEGADVHNNLFADNDGPGLFDEISYSAHIHDNVAVHNSLVTSGGSWGTNAGISLSSSPGNLVERNILYNNAEGFDLREQFRATPRFDHATEAGPPQWPIWNHDETIQNNLISGNTVLQVGIWSDVDDAQSWYWPGTCFRSDGGPCQVSSQVACAVEQETDECQRGDIMLSKFQFIDNFYGALNSQAFIEWGVNWRRYQLFSAIADFQNALPGVDQGGQLVQINYSDPVNLDYRLKSTDMQKYGTAYPVGSIPGVQLGIR